MRKSIFWIVAVLAAVGLVFTGCEQKQESEEEKAAGEEGGEEEGGEGDEAAPGTIVEVATGAGDFATLLAAAEAAGLVETLSGDGPFTVFAPTDAAFGKLPEGTVDELLKPENKEKLAAILTYHVVPGKVMAADVAGMESAVTVQGAELAISTDGDTVKINEAVVAKADIEASNGVIHVVDGVLMPPEDGGDEAGGTIVDVAKEAGNFSTLLAAAEAAGLVETLSGEGPFTVFAPTDEAFGKLPEGTIEELLKPESKDKLVAILTYHVVPGKVMAADVTGMESAKTVQGAELAISTEGDTVKINDATVAKADIEASNGVIHVIDAVVMPPE